MPKTPKISNLIVARAKFVKGSARKLRYVANAVRKLSPTVAMNQLKALPHRSAKILLSVYQQAVANATNNFKLSPDKLKVESLEIQEGPRFKRRDAHAHGARFDSGIRMKKLSHVELKLKGAN
jgi:large subunit ribosomal protein L22